MTESVIDQLGIQPPEAVKKSVLEAMTPLTAEETTIYIKGENGKFFPLLTLCNSYWSGFDGPLMCGLQARLFLTEKRMTVAHIVCGLGSAQIGRLQVPILKRVPCTFQKWASTDLQCCLQVCAT
jgi:hypothetical protein